MNATSAKSIGRMLQSWFIMTDWLSIIVFGIIFVIILAVLVFVRVPIGRVIRFIMAGIVELVVDLLISLLIVGCLNIVIRLPSVADVIFVGIGMVILFYFHLRRNLQGK